MSTYYVIAGGTFVDVAPHFSLAAPAFGEVGRELTPRIAAALKAAGSTDDVRLVLTRMAVGGADRSAEDVALFAAAGIRDLRTNDDLAALTRHLVEQPSTRAMVMASATCDFVPTAVTPDYPSATGFGKSNHPRLSSSSPHTLALEAAEKVIKSVRAKRKDVFLVGFKTTAGAAEEDQYLRGLKLLKGASCNLVLANDVRTHRNMVITPEQARYHQTTDRAEALTGLAEMIVLRSRLTFTRSTVVQGEPVPWSSELVPASLRAVVDHCIARGAYKPFLGSTVGHFAVKVDSRRILTSRRKTDFNHLDAVGLVMIEASGPDSVIAHGSRPSVGGQSQRIIFAEHADADCIVHFHCPRREASAVPVRSQRQYECGSHECGKNTSDGLGTFAVGATSATGATIKAVMLDQHGPNVVFSRHADPAEVIRFIEDNFDLEGRTDELPKDSEAVRALVGGYAYASA